MFEYRPAINESRTVNVRDEPWKRSWRFYRGFGSIIRARVSRGLSFVVCEASVGMVRKYRRRKQLDSANGRKQLYRTKGEEPHRPEQRTETSGLDERKTNRMEQ